MKNQKISVVIPSYNEEKDIAECLKSLEKQDYKNFEIIVVDDGSTDKTREVIKKFKGESKIIFRQMYSLGDNPHKGKLLGSVGGIVIKELKYNNFRFYFITDGYKLKIMDESHLVDLLIRFVRMSDKKEQQQTIDEIRKILLNFGSEGFE